VCVFNFNTGTLKIGYFLPANYNYSRGHSLLDSTTGGDEGAVPAWGWDGRGGAGLGVGGCMESVDTWAIRSGSHLSISSMCSRKGIPFFLAKM
jgi:hypothetical protein